MLCNSCSRRDFIRLSFGGAAAAGLASRFYLPLVAQEAAVGKAKSVILLWLQGAPSQLDTFDPKPGTETGGPIKPIDTAIRGVQFSDYLPRLAKSADKFSLIRTLHSNDPNHDTARYLLHTGYRRDETVDHPHVGSLIWQELGMKAEGLPGCITIGGAAEAGSGYLAPEMAPLIVEKIDNPLEDMATPPGISKQRLGDREKLLKMQNKNFAKSHEEESVEFQQKAYDRALALMKSPHLKAFDIKNEKEAVRKAYGGTPFGKACLMARRLVEAGVRFVEVTLADWDTHSDNFKRTKGLCDQLDPAMAALLGDLGGRDLLKETMVLCMGEFGRTPKINGAQGRDHFTRAFFAALAGGGLEPGRVVGETNADGAEAKSHPVSVQDLYATIYQCLGIDPAKKYRSQTGRPIKILDGGSVVKELL